MDKERCPQKIERSAFTEHLILSLHPIREQHDQTTLADDSFGTRDLSSPNLYHIDCNKNENVNSSYLFEKIPEGDYAVQRDLSMESDSKTAPSYKPPVSPKSWFLRTTRSEGKENTEGAILSSNNISSCGQPKRSNSDILSSRVVRTAAQGSCLDINLNKRCTTDKTFEIAEHKTSVGPKEYVI